MAKHVLHAWSTLQKQKIEDARVSEVPSAQISHILALVNSDPKKGSKPKFSDYLVFKEKDTKDMFPPDAAMVLMALMRERKVPDPIFGVWKKVQEAAEQGAEMPKVRAFRSECKNLWIIAPKIEDGQVNGVVTLTNGLRGSIKLRDIDRPFYTIKVELLKPKAMSYVEETSLRIIA